MTRLLRLVSVIKGASSSAGPLTDIVTETVFMLDNVLSVAVVVSRDHADQNLIKSMALLLSATGGIGAPIATLSAMGDSAKVAQFQAYAKDVLDRICSSDNVVVIDVKSF
jgi:hypothetical protein